MSVRPLVWVVVLGSMLATLPLFVAAIGLAMQCGLCWFMRTVLPPLMTMVVLSLFLGLVLGEKARTVIGRVWLTGFRLTGKLLELVLHTLLKLVRR